MSSWGVPGRIRPIPVHFKVVWGGILLAICIQGFVIVPWATGRVVGVLGSLCTLGAPTQRQKISGSRLPRTWMGVKGKLGVSGPY